MKINRNNFEAYLLDLSEGRLGEEDSRLLRDFLLLNPDCAEEAGDMQPWILETDRVPFPGKDQLKKELPGPLSSMEDSGFGLYSIARMEGDLAPWQVEEHAREVTKNPDRQLEWEAWQQTRLPRMMVEYEKKIRLKKGRSRGARIVWISVASAAAAVALLITLFRTMPGTDQIQRPATEVLQDVIPAADPADPGTVKNQAILADEPVTLSIRKHPDPPELTGKLQGKGGGEDYKKQPPVEQTGPEIQVPSGGPVQPKPARLAVAGHLTRKVPDEGTYDRIHPLDIQYPTSRTGNSFLANYSEAGLGQASREYARVNDISLMSVASAGINGIGRIIGSDLSMDLARDEQGNTTGFSFRSNLLTVSAPRKKAE